MKEQWFFYAQQPRRSARGLGRSALLFATVCAAAAVVSVPVAAAALAFGAAAVYLGGLSWYQLRLASQMARSGVSIGPQGVYVRTPAGEWLFSPEEVCADQTVFFYTGARGRRVYYPGFRLCCRVAVGTLEKVAPAPERAVFAGRGVLLLEPEDYHLLLQQMESYGWLRPCHERAEVSASAPNFFRRRWLYAAGLVCCLTGWLVADGNRIRVAFLLAGLGLAGLLLNSFYGQDSGSDADTPAE